VEELKFLFNMGATMKKAFYSIVFCSALLGVNAAQASEVEIDFDSDPSFHFGIGSPYQQEGFQITNSQDNYNGLLFWGTEPYNADPDGNTLSHNYGGTTMTLTKIGGGLFEFNTIDLADVFNNGSGGDVQFDFLFGNSSTSQTTVTLDNLVGLQRFTFNLLGLSQVSWTPLTTEGQWLQLDHIIVDASVSQVPIPAALWLFGSGLLGLLGFNRKRF
jgi:hypothetical protein